MTDESINDDVLLAAIRRRLLEEIERRGGNSPIVNNVYGGGGTVGGGGLLDQMSGGSSPKIDSEDEDIGQIDPGLFDYMVEINKRDVFEPQIDPETGEPLLDPRTKQPQMARDAKGKMIPMGWSKTVRRFREPRGQDIERATKKKI